MAESSIVRVLITVCDNARQFCPIFPGPAKTLHWNLEDPAEFEGTPAEKREAFIRVREKLAGLIHGFIDLQTAAGLGRVL
jgi:arsenate reductase (thioredoxin)